MLNFFINIHKFEGEQREVVYVLQNRTSVGQVLRHISGFELLLQ